jgi:hypothetical protein
LNRRTRIFSSWRHSRPTRRFYATSGSVDAAPPLHQVAAVCVPWRAFGSMHVGLGARRASGFLRKPVPRGRARRPAVASPRRRARARLSSRSSTETAGSRGVSRSCRNHGVARPAHARRRLNSGSAAPRRAAAPNEDQRRAMMRNVHAFGIGLDASIRAASGAHSASSRTVRGPRSSTETLLAPATRRTRILPR